MEKRTDCSEKTRQVQMFLPYVTDAAKARVQKTLGSGYIGEGPVVAEFEDSFNQLIGTRFSLGLNSCTTALHLALHIAGVGPGDEVITTAQTMAATSHSILGHYARPVYADVQYETGNIDPKNIAHRITDKTKAITVVHWAGYPCDMDEIHAVATKHNLPVIEDAAHAIGSEYKGQPVGTISPFTCFSFQAIKHITTGDGGMLSLTDEEAYNRARRKRWYGIDRKNRKPSDLGEPIWDMSEAGFKYHMNDIAASLGVEHLKDLPAILERRNYIAQLYRKALKDIPGVTLPDYTDDRKCAYWLFTMHVENRLEFIRKMKSCGVEASVVHLRIDRNSVFGGLRDDLPNLDRFNKTQINIPIHNMLKEEDADYVVGCIKEGW